MTRLPHTNTITNLQNTLPQEQGQQLRKAGGLGSVNLAKSEYFSDFFQRQNS